MQPASSQSARSRVAGLSGRTATRPRSAPASSPAPAISSTAAAAAGPTSRGARRARRDRRDRRPAGPQGAPGPKGAAGKGIDALAAEIQLRNHPPKGLRAVPGKPDLRAWRSSSPASRRRSVGFCVLPRSGRPFDLAQDGVQPQGNRAPRCPGGEVRDLREGLRLTRTRRTISDSCLLCRRRRRLGHLRHEGNQHSGADGRPLLRGAWTDCTSMRRFCVVLRHAKITAIRVDVLKNAYVEAG